MSAFNRLEAIFDYNTTPMAPPDIKVLVYDTPTQRHTWAQHGFEAWYIFYAPLHYRKFRFYIPVTRGDRIETTISFSPIILLSLPTTIMMMLPAPLGTLPQH